MSESFEYTKEEFEAFVRIDDTLEEVSNQISNIIKLVLGR